MKKLLLLAVVLGALTMALADPDFIQISAVNKYTSIVTSGDALYWVNYEITYATPPDENISEGWVARLVDVGGMGQLQSVVPTAAGGIPNGGYDRGFFAFYFDTEPITSGTLTVYLTGNPALSPTPVGINTSSIVDRSTGELADDVIDYVQAMENSWDISLLQASTSGPLIFTVTGENYATSAVPGVRAMIPSLFTFSTETQEGFEQGVDNTYLNSLESLFNGTTVQTSIDNMEVGLGVSEATARFIIAGLLMAMFTGGGYMLGGQVGAGGGATGGLAFAAGVLGMFLALLTGLLSGQIFSLIMLIMVLLVFFGVIIYSNRSA